jgi:hypothetical protein
MTTATAPAHPFVSLLAGYLDGTVGDDAMSRFDDLFEDAGATSEERLAFARFYLDVLATGDAAEALPRAAEVGGILAAARA